MELLATIENKCINLSHETEEHRSALRPREITDLFWVRKDNSSLYFIRETIYRNKRIIQKEKPREKVLKDEKMSIHALGGAVHYYDLDPAAHTLAQKQLL